MIKQVLLDAKTGNELDPVSMCVFVRGGAVGMCVWTSQSQFRKKLKQNKKQTDRLWNWNKLTLLLFLFLAIPLRSAVSELSKIRIFFSVTADLFQDCFLMSTLCLPINNTSRKHKIPSTPDVYWAEVSKPFSMWAGTVKLKVIHGLRKHPNNQFSIFY